MKILVSGTGIGGLAATLFLRASGHDVVAIDKAPSFSRRGYLLSLKFFGIGIMKSLGPWDQLQQVGIPYRVFQIHNARGALVKEFPEELEEKATKGSIFLQRPDLHQVPYSAAAKLAEVQFGTHIAGLVQDEKSATVTYPHWRRERFDMVVIAEGLRSSTRHLLWGEEGFHSFGVIYAATMIDANHAVPAQVFQIYFMPGASIMLAHQRQTGFGPVLSGEFCEAAIPAIRSESFCGKVAICFNNPFER